MHWVCPSLHRNLGGLTASDTVGLVVEYAPATGETRVRFPDGVASLHTKRPFVLPRPFWNPFCSTLPTLQFQSRFASILSDDGSVNIIHRYYFLS